MEEESRLFEIFLEVQRGLPRQGPGAAQSTLDALALCRGLPEHPSVLDIGCGPGLQTLVLAEALDGPITAVDLLQEYLDSLNERAAATGLAERIEVLAGDMAELPFPDRSFDLIWAEGSAYIMGFEAAFRAWRRLLKPGGCIAMTELTWLRSDPPAEAAAFFQTEYPAMTTLEANMASLKACGYDLLGTFTLPEAAWWDDYYTPLEARLPRLKACYADDPAARSVVATTEREIDVRRRFGDAYGYVFFVAQKAG
ncbi:class I SAM-dependent methyltransferase [Algihabitans albus]|uniref:class I SAM-dependent methyltransferase n=1 Tax=Algihabitans albus TaxID=2164067 RepID=UPI000E5C7DFA|nr:class I SAM-dependent methyltransferase [Algihabitans albus]